MSDWIDAQGYRANVGIVLMRDDGSVFQRYGGNFQTELVQLASQLLNLADPMRSSAFDELVT